MKVTLRQIQIFDAVAALGSVTAAASRLNMSQSATSSALIDLQIILGRPLFVHAKGRPLQITDEGNRLRSFARSLLSQVEDFEKYRPDTVLQGKLVVGATAVIAETVLPRLCIEFMRQHPGVHIRIDSQSVDELVDRLTRFDLEIALIETLPELESIELTSWRTDELVLVVPPEHPLAAREKLTVEDLAGHSWCLREATAAVTSHLRTMLHEAIGPFDVAFESTSNWAVRHAVRAGGGIGCLSRSLVQLDLWQGRLIMLDVVGFEYKRQLSLARPKHIWRGRLVTAFNDFILAGANQALWPDAAATPMGVSAKSRFS